MDTQTHRDRTGAMGRGSANQFPPMAEVALLGEEGRSVRTQAPVQDEFAKGSRSWRWPGFAREHDGLAYVVFQRDQRKEDRDHELGRRQASGLHTVRHDGMERFAALHALVAVRRLGLAVGATGVFLLRLRGLHHPPQRAVIREYEPTH